MVRNLESHAMLQEIWTTLDGIISLIHLNPLKGDLRVHHFYHLPIYQLYNLCYDFFLKSFPRLREG